MSQEGRRLWLAAWGGENRKLNLRVLFKCESLNKECFSKKTTAWMPLMVSNVHFQTFLGLHREGQVAGQMEGSEPNTTEMGERIFLFSQDPRRTYK